MCLLPVVASQKKTTSDLLEHVGVRHQTNMSSQDLSSPAFEWLRYGIMLLMLDEREED